MSKFRSLSNYKSSACPLKLLGYFLSIFQEDFEKNLPAITTDTTGTEDTFKNNINKENTSQLPGYNPEEKSYTNMSKESRL